MVSRALSLIDTLHPVHEGRIYRWRDDSVEEEAATDYARTDQAEACRYALRGVGRAQHLFTLDQSLF